MNSTSKRQQGSTLLIALVLLLLLSVVTYFAVRTGLSEQRTSTSDARAKVAHRVAESGLDHAVEYVRLRGATLMPAPGVAPASTLWTQCTASDSSFPCGAEADTARRANLYYFSGGTDNTANAAAAAVDLRSLPLTQSFTTVGNFPVTYNVGALLCMINASTVGTGSAAQCTTDASASTTSAVTLVSTGQIDGESARATITETIGSFRIVNNLPGLPPVVSSGILNSLGNGTVVANPNSGGPGVPLSTWTRATSDPGGSYQTCYLDEFLRSGGTSELSDTGVVTCSDCGCPAIGTISSRGTEGEDMLDRDDTDGGVLQATTDYSFPCDLFGYVFGIDAREDLGNPGGADDYDDDPPLCETQIDTDGDGTPDVEEFLEANATKVATGESPYEECSDLVDTTADGGFFWMPDGCALVGNSGNPQVGSPDNPVILVVDGSFAIRGPTVYGVVFVRDPNAVLGGDIGGGAAEAGGNGNGSIVGSMIIEGGVRLNGTVDIVSSPQVLRNIQNNPNNLRYGRVPGSWNDSLSY